ncbi:MAG TPA: DUF554 domain-containing protein [Aquificaceae bacterium]|nr:DUF554 domain-containing protein [Aquificaceae bacterium]HIQ31493.1 DUF554 domain-containing protein [Aquifex aeolicus]
MFPGFGTLVNFLLVLMGSYAGLRGARFINPRLREGVVHGIALFTLLLGANLIRENEPDTLKVFLILLFGTAIGYALDLEGALEKAFRSDRGSVKAFVTSSVLFTVGPMTLLGCILEGTKGDSSLLLSKAAMDGFSSIILASSLGRGVMFSAPFILLFQGSITALAFFFGDFIDPSSMSNSLFIGGGIMILIALKLWGLLQQIKSVNFLIPLILALFL